MHIMQPGLLDAPGRSVSGGMRFAVPVGHCRCPPPLLGNFDDVYLRLSIVKLAAVRNLHVTEARKQALQGAGALAPVGRSGAHSEINAAYL